MIKLSANLSKKVPLPDVEFSSQQYGAAMEVEVSDAADPKEVTDRLQAIYRLLEKSIDEQIGTAARPAEGQEPQARTSPGQGSADNGSSPNNGHSNGQNNGRHATSGQVRAIFAISRERNHNREELLARARQMFHVNRIDDLTVRQASDMIVELQKLETKR
jgi:hypothetical protein